MILSITAVIVNIVAILALAASAVMGGFTLLFWDDPAAGPYLLLAVTVFIIGLLGSGVCVAFGIRMFQQNKRLLSLELSVAALIIIALAICMFVFYIPHRISLDTQANVVDRAEVYATATRDFVPKAPTAYLPDSNQFIQISGTRVIFWHDEESGQHLQNELGTINADGSADFVYPSFSDKALQELVSFKDKNGNTFADEHPLQNWIAYLGFDPDTQSVADGMFTESGAMVEIKITKDYQVQNDIFFQKGDDGKYSPTQTLSAADKDALLKISTQIVGKDYHKIPVDLRNFLDIS